jgi:phenylpropionate dioxygenase-like ring-hydroxylating dioxygenase large terminal subunit
MNDQAIQLPDPPTLRNEAVRPTLTMQQVLAADKVRGPDNLYEVSPDTLAPTPIAASRYVSPEFAAREKDKVWLKVWQMGCWAQDIPNPGDIHVYRNIDKSVLIVRQRDGSVRAFLNVCLHRGRELCEHHTNQAELKCPYHYFTWGLDGAHKWTPSKWDFPQIDEAHFNLPEVRVEEWNGFLFVNFDNAAPSLKDFMGQRWLDHWSAWDFTGRYKAVHVEKHINCNWKTGQDAFIEGFHAFASHSQGAVFSAEDCGQVDIYHDAPNMSRMVLPLGVPSHRLDPQPSDADVFDMMVNAMTTRQIGKPGDRLREGERLRDGYVRLTRDRFEAQWGIDASGVSECEAVDAISYFMFPNFMPWSSMSYPLVYRFRPGKDPDWCIWDTMLLYPFTGERPPSCETVVLGPDDPMLSVEPLGGLALVLHQDAVQLPAVQRGMKQMPGDALTISAHQEMRIRHYHKLLDEYLSR